MREHIDFLCNGERVTLHNIDPTRTVLQYLREDAGFVGTKEGCAEGDCGACTVVIAQPNHDATQLRYQAVNACIQFLPTLHGRALITVEGLTRPGKALHPVQQSLVDCHGSQCGFCTPGFVMSMFALYQSQAHATRREIDTALAGNLCRCTGYRPIIEAAQRMYDHPHGRAGDGSQAGNAFDDAHTLDALAQLGANESVHLRGAGKEYFAPVTADELADLLVRFPEARILAGGTDIGLWVTKQHRQLDVIVYLCNVRELAQTQVTATAIVVGAAVSLTDALPVVAAQYPQLRPLFERFASPPIRNAGTVCGNIANGSPIGDVMPVFIALGATVVLRRGAQRRHLPLEDYYIEYGRTALEPGEFVEQVEIPLPRAGQLLGSYKLSKRFDQDISAVCAAFCVVLENHRVVDARIAYGGVAATPKRAPECEAVLRGAPWTEATVAVAMDALEKDYSPIGDMRASAHYRQRTMRNLLRRFFLDCGATPCATDVYDYGR